MSSLRDLLEQRAERGEERGPDTIAERALRESLSSQPPRRSRLVVPAAAAVLVIALVAGVLVARDDRKNETRVTTAPASTGWVKTSPAPIAGRLNAATATDGRRLFIWGGDGDGSTALDDGALYDPSTDAWESVPPAPAAMRRPDSAAAAWDGSRFLVAAGFENGPHETMLAAYDPATRAWQQLADAPLRFRFGFTALWTGWSLIVAGSTEQPGASPFGAMYDPSVDRWTVLPEPTAESRDMADLLWDGTALVALGGSPGIGEYYVPGSDGWKPVTAATEDPPQFPFAGAVATSVGAMSLFATDQHTVEPWLLVNDRRSLSSWHPGDITLDSHIVSLQADDQDRDFVIVTERGGIVVSPIPPGMPKHLPRVDLSERYHAPIAVVGRWLVVWGGQHFTTDGRHALGDGVRINLESYLPEQQQPSGDAG